MSSIKKEIITGSRVLCWFSCGAASAVATKLSIAKYGERAVPVYCQTNAEHKDNERFLADCEKWFGVPVARLQSTEYADIWDVFERRSYISGINGAPCTTALKIIPRVEFQRVDDIHVFGYTADKEDTRRAKSLASHFFELTIECPLIDYGLRKEECLAMVERAGIDLPVMYGLGFRNNNCIPCVKATSPNYWALVRENFPEEFNRMAALSRRLGARLARINDERIFIDEIPDDWPTNDPMQPACDFLCHIAEQEYAGD